MTLFRGGGLTFVLLVWFRITLTTFHAKTISMYLRFHFSRTPCIYHAATRVVKNASAAPANTARWNHIAFVACSYFLTPLLSTAASQKVVRWGFGNSSPRRKYMTELFERHAVSHHHRLCADHAQLHISVCCDEVASGRQFAILWTSLFSVFGVIHDLFTFPKLPACLLIILTTSKFQTKICFLIMHLQSQLWRTNKF